MQPLTEQIWSQQFADLRALVHEEFPTLARQDLQTVGGDWDALIALVQRTYNLDADVVRQRIEAIDIDQAEPAAAGGDRDDASVEQLRLGAGFNADEQDSIRDLMSKLNRRLSKFPADAVDMELSVKDRDTTSQKVTLEAWLPKFPHFAAVSQEPDLHDALMDVREDLLRQVDDEVSKRQDY